MMNFGVLKWFDAFIKQFKISLDYINHVICTCVYDTHHTSWYIVFAQLCTTLSLPLNYQVNRWKGGNQLISKDFKATATLSETMYVLVLQHN